MNWWLIIRTPTGVFAWSVWGENDEPDEALIDAARVLTGVPADDGWIFDRSYDLQLTRGEPHPSLQATISAVADLLAVSDITLNTYRAERIRVGRQTQIDAVKAAYDLLDAAARTEVVTMAIPPPIGG